jgi:hypothetical protein
VPLAVATNAVMAEIMNHKMKIESYGKKSFSLCEYCGTARHSGFWWLAGYRSKIAPPCAPHEIDENWRINAEEIPIDA